MALRCATLIGLLITLLFDWYHLSSWMVDDAAISLAYAQNLVAHGILVHQLGMPPVEGFSNPLWVFILAAANLFTPDPDVAKWLGMLLLIVGVIRLAFSTPDSVSGPLASLLLMTQPSLHIWSHGGLENSLLLVLVIEWLIQSRALALTGNTRRAYTVAILTGLISITRPEGICVLGPFVVAVFMVRSSLKPSQLISVATLAILIPGAYLIFRILYFDDVLPNTYYAKGGAELRRIADIFFLDPHLLNKVTNLAGSVSGAILSIPLLILIVVCCYKAFLSTTPYTKIVAFHFLTWFIVYLIMRDDWMPEFRFATPFYISLYVLLTETLTGQAGRFLVATIIMIQLVPFTNRIIEFSQSPPISIEEVKLNSHEYVKIAKSMGISRPLVLTADIGGLLLENEVDVLDLGMLCDRTIAHAIGEGSSDSNQQAFLDYVFEKRPDIIDIKAYHSYISGLQYDSRFYAYYSPLSTYVDSWIRQRYGIELISGVFVRKSNQQVEPAVQ